MSRTPGSAMLVGKNLTIPEAARWISRETGEKVVGNYILAILRNSGKVRGSSPVDSMDPMFEVDGNERWGNGNKWRKANQTRLTPYGLQKVLDMMSGYDN